MEHPDAIMRHAVELAERGRWSTSPNPRVGCVIVRGERILAEGWHERAGGPHAEIVALDACPDPPAGATMYVTLEPCSHTGRTGPCTRRIIESQIKRVFVALEDPDPRVAGSGIRQLREAGIEVIVGPGGPQSERLNEAWLHSARTSSPYVILKAGLTLDGKLATVRRESRWITSEGSRLRSLELREEADAILVGAGTVRDDDPQLTRRLELNTSAQPWRRVVLDSPEGIPMGSRVLNDAGPTLIFTPDPERYEGKAEIETIPTASGTDRIDLRFVLRELHARDVRSLIVEGGALIHAAFIEERLWQRMELFIAPMIVGGAEAPSMFSMPGIPELTQAVRVRFDTVETLGPDIHIVARPHNAT